jgi:hypothetical protein
MIWSMAIIINLKLQYPQVYFKSILSMNNLNVIPTQWSTKYIMYGRRKCNTYMTIWKCTLCVGSKMQYPHYDFNPHYMWEREMQCMHDNWSMHIVCGAKMQYPHYDLNPHYIWETKMQYMHDNWSMYIVCGAKMQYSQYDLNPHYLWERQM